MPLARLLRRATLALLVLAGLMVASAPALAQGAHPFAGGPAAREAPAEAQDQPGWWTRLAAGIRAKQVQYHRQLAGAVRAVQSERPWAALLTLSALAFAYGVFHALGPGHGKAVVTTYVLTNETALRRALAISAASSALQAAVAVVLVYGVLLVAALGTRRLAGSAQALELFSYALVTAVGAVLLAKAAQRLVTLRRGGDAAHVHDDKCGHAHLPDTGTLAKATDLRTAAAVVLSVGSRPCTGAILVLVFAYSLGLHLAGIAAAFAMAVGTGLTVAAIAALAFYARVPGRLIGQRMGANLAVMGAGAAGLGGLALVAMGLVLLGGALLAPAPLAL